VTLPNEEARKNATHWAKQAMADIGQHVQTPALEPW